MRIANFRWHDLHHTWASWHVQSGTPLQVLKELGGWETIEMVQKYAHLAADHLAQWVSSMMVKEGVLAGGDCNFTADSAVKQKYLRAGTLKYLIYNQ